MRPLRGLPIGSQIAAGGAALVAAFIEHLYLRSLRPDIREELLRLTFIKRWLDDILFVWNTVMSKRTLGALRAMQDREFYGKYLILERVREPEPFGFRISFSKEGIALRSRLAFVGERAKQECDGFGSERSTLHGGPQFRSRQIDKGILFAPWTSLEKALTILS